MSAWIGLAGIAVLIALAVLLSTDRKAIRPRIVVSAFALQVLMAVLALYVPAGRTMIRGMSDGVLAVIDFANQGITMIFGELFTQQQYPIFAINVLPVIVFFASLMGVLYHLGVMQWVVRIIGTGLQRLLGTGPVESLNAAANIFVGFTEAPLVVKPYLVNISRPQMFAIMTSGTASVSGTVLAAYAGMGAELEYLLAACFMAAPGGLL
ncbi:MAG: Na+ dependent nucleoside transporter N-terminal domain-containing protein, partial [Pseudomonadota bacterium]